VVERTLRGALGIEYPVDKLTIYLLDDGGSEQGRELVDRLNRELAPQRPPKLVYVARLRKAGVPHHAKVT
jgi:cellulose synthase/poly-beta-1,6-N-acetylglucosamine synthase-like glycosyltransferase